MPNALLEAMGRGCVPLVTRMESGVPELVQDGVNGCVVPIGDIRAFGKCLKLLHQDPEERRSLSLKAYETVSAGNFRTQDMVQAYVRMAEDVLDEMNNGKYKRPPGILQPPPPHVGGVGIFPIPLTHKEDGLGLFPTRSRDFRQFKNQVGQLKDPLHRALRQTVNRGGHTEHLNDVRVVVGSPTWTYTGVNEFSANLVRGLMNKGVSAHILLTEEKTNLVDIRAARMPHPTDIPFEHLSVDRSESWGGHWGAMIR